MDKQFELEHQSEASLPEELWALDAETFEIEDFSNLNQDAALSIACSCSSSSTSACCSCVNIT
ncbi:MAG TPA: thiazolylpeptide-type bacteriocin [Ktedonobacteraceae bacterium]|nr:thiazolylpeptide-type bacteriocin [Ktedonobacteraceae bacterium]